MADWQSFVSPGLGDGEQSEPCLLNSLVFYALMKVMVHHQASLGSLVVGWNLLLV